MFGREKKSEIPLDEVPASVIPAEFYAGASPVISFPKIGTSVRPKTTELTPQHTSRFVAPVTNNSLPNTSKAPPSSGLLANRKFVVGSGVLLFVIFVAGASVYYWYMFQKSSVVGTKLPPEINVTESSTVPAITEIVPSSTVSTIETGGNTASTSPTLAGGSIVFPPITLGQTSDSDGDGLTDEEEEAFRTDAKNGDTDADTYSDGVEVFNLYSPIDTAPAKLATTNLVALFSNETFGYTLLYPANWAHGAVSSDESDVLFSTLTGENVEVRVIPWPNSFASWFTTWAPRERFEDLVPFTTREGLAGYKRPDNLVFYFPTATRVYVIVYNPGKDQTVYYPHVPAMIARSFRLPMQKIEENPRDVQVPQKDIMPPGVTTATSSARTL